MTSQDLSERTRRILLLPQARQDDPELQTQLGAWGEVTSPDADGSPADLLADGSFDFVVGSAQELLALAAQERDDQTRRVLELVGQAVCIVDGGGQLVWGNRKLSSYPAEVVEKMRAASAAHCQQFAGAKGDPQTIRRQSLRIGREHFFELTSSPLDSSAGVERVLTLAWDTSSQRGLQEKINAIDAAGRELVGLDVEAIKEMDVQERLTLLEEKIIAYSHDLLHFDHFAVRILDKRDKRLNTVLAAGLPEAATDLELFASAEGNGISGYVAASKRSYICPDVSKDARYVAGLDNARSSLTIPLELHDEVIGILNVESDQVAAFTEDDRQIGEIFARYIAIALHILQLLVVERHTTTGQIAADVDAEMAAPLNEIVSDVSRLLEEYGADPALRERLQRVVADVDRVREAIHAVTEPTGGVVGLTPAGAEKDPVIRGRRVLVVDDEDIIRETIADVLNKYGANTTLARDGDDAVRIAKAQRFDLVLSDIKMPKRSGYEVFAAVRQAHPACPVILITGFGYDPNHSIVRASKEGLSGVLFKPFKVEQLLEEVRHALLGTDAK